MTRTFPAALAACTLAFTALAAAPAPAMAQTGFEGVITFQQYNKNDGTHSTMVQTSKGRKVKWEGMGGRNHGAMIFDGDAHTMIMVDPEKKTYITVTQADMDQMAAMMKPMADSMKALHKSDSDSKFKVDLAKTGRTETVAGTRCEVWHGTTTEDGKKKEGEACLASGVGLELYDIMVNNPMMKQRDGALENMMDKYKQMMSGGKGLLKVTTIENGKSTVEMEATKIERKSIGDDAFKPPAGYTGQSMGQMMQQAAQQMQMMKERMQKAQGKPSDKN